MEVDEQAGLVTEQTERGPQSPMEALRAKRDQIEARRDAVIPLTEYDDPVIKVRYRLLERKETEDIAVRNRKIKDRGDFMYAMLVDLLIAGCEGFVLVDDETHEDGPLMSENGHAEIDSYAAFASELKGVPASSHRQAVLYVFGGNEFAVGQHALLYQRWLQNTNLDIDTELFAMEG